MARHAACHSITAILALAISTNSYAQSLAEPSPINKVMGANQFGMPQDAKFIFCEGGDCPDRTTKSMPAPTQPPSPIVVAPPQPPLGIPPELSRAKEAVPRYLKTVTKHKRHRAHKHLAKTNCGLSPVK